MADISTYLSNIKSAVYGEEVRDSIHDSIEAINTDVSSCVNNYNDFQNASDTYIKNRLESAMYDSKLVQEALNAGISGLDVGYPATYNTAQASYIYTLMPFEYKTFTAHEKNGIGHLRLELTYKPSINGSAACFNGTELIIGCLGFDNQTTSKHVNYISGSNSGYAYNNIIQTSNGHYATITLHIDTGAIGINAWGINATPTEGDYISTDFIFLTNKKYTTIELKKADYNYFLTK